MRVPHSDTARDTEGERGSALVAILWIIAILSMAVFSATQFLFIELESESNASSLFHAELLADRGIAIASHPRVEKGDPLLIQSVSANDSFAARISSEGDRLNLNSLLENAEFDRIVLEQLFSNWGLRTDIAADVVDNLIDWVDEDSDPTSVGAEQNYYFSQDRLNHPFNRPFESLNAVLLVKDFNLVVAANPGWQDAFTLLSGGQLDINEAPAELIAATCLCSVATADQFISIRNGLDQIPGTIDDIKFESVDEALQILRVPEGAIEDISARLSVEDPAKRLISIGRSGSIAVERSVTIQYTGEQGSILSWTTRRIE